MTKPIDDVMKKMMAEVSPGEHIGIPELADYQDQLLPGEDMNRVRAHLTVCPDCTNALLELLALAQGNLEAAALAPATPQIGSFPNYLRKLVTRLEVAWACVGGLLLVLAVFGSWGYREQQLREAWEKPDTDVVIYDLFPIGENQKAGDPKLPIPELETARGQLLLVLHPEADLSLERYTVLLAGNDGSSWMSGPLKPQLDSFILALPQAYLNTGSYRLTLIGHEGDVHREIAHFELQTEF